MTVKEAMNTRRTTRAFLPTPVEKEKLDAILKDAARTPSWTNSQPWEVFIATGKALERIKAAYKENHDKKVPPTNETPAPTPEQWSESAVKRREQVLADRISQCGEDALKLFGSHNQAMFYAPAVIYIYMDKVLTDWSLYDVGSYAQSIMLLATEQGLSTMPAASLTLFPEVQRRELKIPDHLRLTIGIAIGYADKDNIINSFISSRKPLSETVHYVD